MAARDDTKDLKSDADRLAADLEQIKADIKKLTGTIGALGRNGLDAARSEGAERLGALRDEVDDLATSLTRKGRHQIDVIEGQMRDKPLLALLTAFGVGLLAARVIDRR